ncbi:FMN-dependent NADH-azoreductase [Cupriavidus gilardii]|uniref:FMN-dependent NADH-azoreductase n=1 Tax=Cupriavidus gilardii TaxID=82541 RepID=UPI0021BF7904|nr:NAD(P)H-dependent oxidoreductase [Cupriavidus gilardii]MCT9127348.1 NAD(P)H-dependent oxidoreductase [Cupriavidus gilardii]
MKTVLHVSASPNGEASTSRATGAALIERMRQRETLRVVERDLARRPPPLVDGAFAHTSLAAESTDAASDTGVLAFSASLIAELQAADRIVISTPMHNFTVPATLKAWIDQILRPGRTFARTPEGKKGLLASRPVYLIVGSGGPLGDDGKGQPDFLTPYLRHALATAGLHDLSVLRLDNLRRGPAYLERAQALADAWIAQQIAALSLNPPALTAQKSAPSGIPCPIDPPLRPGIA